MMFPNAEWNAYLESQQISDDSESKLAQAIARMIEREYPDVEETDFLIIDNEDNIRTTHESDMLCCGFYYKDESTVNVELSESVSVSKSTLILLAGKNNS